jgi:hypothetical protein
MFVAHPNSPQEAKTRKALGYWKLRESPEDKSPLGDFMKRQAERYASLPDPKDFVDLTWNEGERNLVVGYLKNGVELIQWRGSSGCRICGIHNGSTCKGDDVFIWPAGFAHYVEAHNVRPPEEFINHVKKALAAAMVNPIRCGGHDYDRRFKEPMPTEADHQRMREMEARMGEERRHAIEAGERLPPISVDLWPTKD